MTQPTIKEKIKNTCEELEFRVRTRVHVQNWLPHHEFRELLHDFARLICEEMTGIKDEDFHLNNYDSGRQVGRNIRICEEEQKAQEILKSLE